MKNKQARVALLLRPRTLDIGQVDLNTVEDGTYMGVCQNKILFAVVRVEVSGHEIRSIEILEHKESYLPQAEMTAQPPLPAIRLKKQSRMLCYKPSNKRKGRFNEDHFEIHSIQYQRQKDANRGYAAVHYPVHYLTVCILVHW